MGAAQPSGAVGDQMDIVLIVGHALLLVSLMHPLGGSHCLHCCP